MQGTSCDLFDQKRRDLEVICTVEDGLGEEHDMDSK
jgi:hypothetical protein